MDFETLAARLGHPAPSEASRDGQFHVNLFGRLFTVYSDGKVYWEAFGEHGRRLWSLEAQQMVLLGQFALGLSTKPKEGEK